MKQRWKRRIGYRGTFLLLLWLIFTIYGASLINSTAVNATWWPVSQVHLWGLNFLFWGCVWIGVGTLMLIGSVLKPRSCFYALAAGMSTLWAFFTVLWCVRFHVHGGWGLTAIYGGLAALIVFTACWPEPDRIILIDTPPATQDQ